MAQLNGVSGSYTELLYISDRSGKWTSGKPVAGPEI